MTLSRVAIAITATGVGRVLADQWVLPVVVVCMAGVACFAMHKGYGMEGWGMKLYPPGKGKGNRTK